MNAPWRHIVRLFSMILVLLWVGNGLAAELEATGDGRIDPHVTDLTLAEFAKHKDAGKTIASYSYRQPTAKYIRLLIGAVELSAGDELEITGVNMSATGDANGVSFKGPLSIREPFLTGLIYGGRVDITLTSGDIGSARLVVKNIIYQFLPKPPQLSIFDTDGDGRLNFTEVSDPLVKSVGGSVIFLAYLDGMTPRVCSGFVINSTMVMTNDHCVNTAAKCATATIVFDYLNVGGGNIMGQQRRCVSVKDSLEVLDFAVLELDQPVANGVNAVALAETDAMPGVQTFLIQHPGGEHKQLSETGCRPIDMGVPGLDATQTTDFTHRCDTLGGSSGSPILVAAGEGDARRLCVTGLHHLGFQDDSDFSTKNRAVKISLIASRLKEKTIQYTSCGN